MESYHKCIINAVGSLCPAIPHAGAKYPKPGCKPKCSWQSYEPSQSWRFKHPNNLVRRKCSEWQKLQVHTCLQGLSPIVTTISKLRKLTLRPRIAPPLSGTSHVMCETRVGRTESHVPPGRRWGRLAIGIQDPHDSRSSPGISKI